MTVSFSKRLAKLEEQLAAKINAPIAWLWLNADETEEQACAKAGIDPSEVHRIRFIRSQTADEVVAAKEPAKLLGLQMSLL